MGGVLRVVQNEREAFNVPDFRGGKKKEKEKKKKDKNYSLLFAVDEPINLKICTAIKRRSKLESCSGAERL